MNSDYQRKLIRSHTGPVKGLKLVLLMMLLASAPVQGEKPLRVTLLSPGTAESGFWGSLIAATKAAAEDLNVDLTVVISEKSEAQTRLDGLAIIRSDDPPDYLISSYWYPAAEDFIPEARKHGVNIFTINNPLPDYERMHYGEPREKYPNWIAHSYVNEFEVGQQLVDILCKEAMRLGLAAKTDNILHVSGLAAGNEKVLLHNNDEYVRALRLYTNGKTNIELDGVYYAYWSRPIAKTITAEILRRHSNTRVIWAQNHRMALGAIDALIEGNIRPGREIVIGGFNWTSDALQAIAKGDMHVTIGGHFLAGAVALILIHDYHNGIDFVDDTGVQMITPVYPITAGNIQKYIKVLDKTKWNKIDFRQFSKKYNPDLKHYNFTPENFFGL